MNQIQTMDGAVNGPQPADGAALQPNQLKIFNAAIQKIDVQNQTLGDPFYRTAETDIKNYLTGLIDELLKNKRNQSFKIETTGEVGKLVTGLSTKNLKNLQKTLVNGFLISKSPFRLS